MIGMQNNFPQFQNNNQKLNQNQNLNINKNNFIPNITPVINNMPEMVDPMENQDMTTEILNISKIKEGFYIGDRISAISLDVIIQFKITHMINATGNQITNQWEAIGISYLTLNWSETPNQILFDPKDEIANRIVEFIDNSYNVGEGVLAHSFRGCNRVCIVVIIYLMKKYRWSLKKSLEYLKSKKQDIDIPTYFFEQLQKFENRMKMRKELTVDIPWEFEGLKDPEEKVMRNTYLNGFKPEIPKCAPKEKDKLRHIIWADMNSYQKCPIEISNTENDLFFKKDVKPIYTHLQIKPKKSCIKGSNNIINSNNNKIASENILNKISYNSNTNNSINKINNIINNTNNINMMNNNNDIRNIMNNNNNINIIKNNLNRPNYENEKNEKISYNNFMQQKGNKRNHEQQINDFKNILNKNYNYNNEKNNNFGNLMRFNKQEPVIQNKENEKKDKSPLRNWLDKERNINNENKFGFDFIENKDINDLQNKIKNNMRINNSINIPKSSQMNMDSLNQGFNMNKNNIKNNFNNNMNNNMPNTTNYFKMNNNNSNNNSNINMPFQINNSMNINHNIINNNNIEVSKSQNQKALNNFINDIRTNDFGNLANSVAPRQNKFINLPEHSQNNKNRNKSDYSPILRENKKNNKINNNIPNNNLNFEHNVNNSAGFMNLNNLNKNNQMLVFDNFNINREEKKNIMNNNSINQNKMMSNTMNNFNNNNNYAHFNNFNNEKKFKVNDYSNNNLNSNNNFINYTPLIEDRHINNLINHKLNENQQHRMNNNNIINEKISRQNKNMYNNRPLNNFNPSLIKRKGTPQLGGHTSLLDRNQTTGPIKIKNGNKYNNNYIGNNNSINNHNNHNQKKKPTTPDLNLNHKQKHDFIDLNNNTNSNINNHKYKYNGNMNINSYNFNNRANNTMPNGFGYTGGPNNYKKSNTNSLGMTRPSTAPHKDKEKLIKNNNKANYQNGLKHNQRPSSAGGKNKNLYGNNFNNNINNNNNRIGIGLGKNLSNANMNTKNRKKKLINEINKRLSTPQINSSNPNSNAFGFNNNMNNNYGNNNNFRPKLNQAKNRMPSPMIKSNNNYRRPPLPNKNRIRTNKSDKFN